MCKEMHKYWLGARRSFSDAKLIAYQNDGSRVGGRKRHFGVIMDLDTGVCAWTPPLANLLSLREAPAFLSVAKLYTGWGGGGAVREGEAGLRTRANREGVEVEGNTAQNRGSRRWKVGRGMGLGKGSC